jgi:hypothetical protein
VNGFVSRLNLVSDVSAADWVRDRIDTFGPVVGGMLPIGFDAYAKVLHPARGPGNVRIRWSEVADWSGRVLDQDAWFEDLSVPIDADDRGPLPWEQEPPLGEIPEDLLAVLVELLARHTASTHGWFCLWNGWACVHGSMTKTIAWPDDHPPPPGTPTSYRASPAFPETILEGPKVQLPHRDYLLFEGPLDAANELGATVPWGSFTTFERQPPSLWWPDDHAWCAANEIDASFTCIGGSVPLIDELLNHRDLEVLSVTRRVL